MKNQKKEKHQIHLEETLAVQIKRNIIKTSLPKAGSGSGYIPLASVVFCFMMSGCTSSSRPSTPSEKAAQEKFQTELVIAQEKFQQEIDSATIMEQHQSDSIIKQDSKYGADINHGK